MKVLLVFPFFFVLVVAQNQRKVAFTAYFSDMGEIDIGRTNPIAFNKVTVNAGNGYNTETGIFTAPVCGIYLFMLSVKGPPNLNGLIRLGIYKSGSLVMANDLRQTVYDKTTSFVTLHVLAGETVYVRHMVGPTIIDKWYETSFTGILLFPD